MALGATRTNVWSLILRQGMQPVIVGAFLGLLFSAIASSVVHAFLVLPGAPDVLFGVSFLDPLSFVSLSVFPDCRGAARELHPSAKSHAR